MQYDDCNYYEDIKVSARQHRDIFRADISPDAVHSFERELMPIERISDLCRDSKLPLPVAFQHGREATGTVLILTSELNRKRIM